MGCGIWVIYIQWQPIHFSYCMALIWILPWILLGGIKYQLWIHKQYHCLEELWTVIMHMWWSSHIYIYIYKKNGGAQVWCQLAHQVILMQLAWGWYDFRHIEGQYRYKAVIAWSGTSWCSMIPMHISVLILGHSLNTRPKMV